MIEKPRMKTKVICTCLILKNSRKNLDLTFQAKVDSICSRYMLAQITELGLVSGF